MISRPQENSERPPVLFVHGAWHGPWCWERWMDVLFDAGYPVYAVELPGHGQSRPSKRIWNHLSDYVDEVSEALDELGPETVLVGHSMGGLVTQIVLERKLVPLAVLVASVPRRGAFRSALRVIGADPVNGLTMFPLGTMWKLVNTKEKVRQWFFSPDSDEADVTEVAGQLQNESLLAFAAMLVRLPKPSRVKSPVRVIAARSDAIFSVAEQEHLARAYGTEAVIIENAGHDIMVDGEHGVAGVEHLLEMLYPL